MGVPLTSLTTILSYYVGHYYMFEILRPTRAYYFDNIVTPSACFYEDGWLNIYTTIHGAKVWS